MANKNPERVSEVVNGNVKYVFYHCLLMFINASLFAIYQGYRAIRTYTMDRRLGPQVVRALEGTDQIRRVCSQALSVAQGSRVDEERSISLPCMSLSLNLYLHFSKSNKLVQVNVINNYLRIRRKNNYCKITDVSI